MLVDTVREAAGNLLGSAQRSFLALLGIVIGTGAVIAMIHVGAIARNESLKQFRDMGTDMLTVQVNGTIQPDELSANDIVALPATIPSLSAIAPLAIGGIQAGFRGQTVDGTLVATTGSFAAAARLRLREGRFISRFDTFEMFCVIGADLADRLANGGAPLRAGDPVKLGGEVFTVIGITAPMMNTPLLPISVGNSVFTSSANAKRVMPSARITHMVARIAPTSTPEEAVPALRDFLKEKLRAARPKIETADQLIANMESQMELFTLLLAATGSIALILGGVGIMNLMLVSVSERQREIGIRLAVGARRWDIQLLFLSEAMILSITGGLIGVAVGAVAAWGFARYSGWEFFFVPSSATLGAGVSAAVGIFFGFYPAVLASRLDPIEALRSE